MRFKTFLAEEPYSGSFPIEYRIINCPEHNHKFDLNHDVYLFDYAAEMTGNDVWFKKLKDQIGARGNFKGIVPMYCKEHNKIFMYNLDTKTSYIPESEEEKEMCRLLVLGLISIKNDLTAEQKAEISALYPTNKLDKK